MDNKQLSDMFQHMRRDPLSPLDRVLALQDPHSFEYKKLIDLYQVVAEKNELCVQLMTHLVQVRVAEELAFAGNLEKKLLRMEEKEKRETAFERNEEIRAEHRELAAKIAAAQPESIDSFKHLYEEKIAEVAAKNEEIRNLETSWKSELNNAADDFIKDNFKIENGKVVSQKTPNIELLDGALDVIKKIFTDAKSPAEMHKHNPNLIDNPERMMAVDDVRKEIHMAKKIDKIVAKDVRDEADKGRKIVIKKVVLDDEGNPVYEVGADGKRKVKTERVELTPETRKLKDDQATDESTKKKKARLVCLGDVCFIRDELLVAPVSHTSELTDTGAKLLTAASERSALEMEVQALKDKMNGLKAVAPMQVDAAHEQHLISKDVAVSEKTAAVPEAPPPPEPYRPKR